MIFLWAPISPGKKRTRVSLIVKKGLKSLTNTERIFLLLQTKTLLEMY
jgi:hypothetical protein